MSIDASRLEEIFEECITDAEMGGDVESVEGVVHSVKLHIPTVEKHRKEIQQMIDCLPAEFNQGWTFLNLCMDKDGNQWTGLHLTMEKLVMLSMVLGLASWSLPKEFWSALPGGMPYVTFKGR